MVRLGLLTSVVLLALCASPTVAQANTTPGNQPSGQQMADAVNRMLVWEDVPRTMKVAPGWEFTTKADKSLALELCTKNGQEILAPEAPILFQVELGETDLQEDPNSFQQNIWQYENSADAQRAWAILQQRALKCTGRVLERAPGQRTNVQYLTNGTTELMVNDRPGVWVHSRFARPVGEDAATEGGYYVMFLNGSAIQSVEYDYPDTVDLNPALRAQVQKIAKLLVDRWNQ